MATILRQTYAKVGKGEYTMLLTLSVLLLCLADPCGIARIGISPCELPTTSVC